MKLLLFNAYSSFSEYKMIDIILIAVNLQSIIDVLYNNAMFDRHQST